MEPLRFLQIGLGIRGRVWFDLIQNRSDTQHSGLVDSNPQQLEPYKAFPNIPTFLNIAEAVAQTESDAILLATSPGGRYEQLIPVLPAGLPLLVEKPLALDFREAASIVHQTRENAVPLMVGMNFRYLPVSQKIRQLVSRSELGSCGYATFIYLRNRDGYQPGLNRYPLTMNHPMLLEQSIHHFDLIRYCYEREVTNVMCRTWNPSWSMYRHHSNVDCILSFKDGLVVSYTGTWTSGSDDLRFEWRTDCSHGVIVQRQLLDDLVIAHPTDTHLSQVELPSRRAPYDGTDGLLNTFIEHIAGKRPLECSGEDHLRTLAICFAAIESSETGCSVNPDNLLNLNLT